MHHPAHSADDRSSSLVASAQACLLCLLLPVWFENGGGWLDTRKQTLRMSQNQPNLCRNWYNKLQNLRFLSFESKISYSCDRLYYRYGIWFYQAFWQVQRVLGYRTVLFRQVQKILEYRTTLLVPGTVRWAKSKIWVRTRARSAQRHARRSPPATATSFSH